MVHLLWGVDLVHSEVAVLVPVEREKVWFVSGGTECAAWHYPGAKGGVAGRRPRLVPLAGMPGRGGRA